MFISITKQGDENLYFIDTRNFNLDINNNNVCHFGMDKNFDVIDQEAFICDALGIYMDTKYENYKNAPDNLIDCIIDFYSKNLNELIESPDWEEYKKNAFDNIAYKVVISKNENELYIFKNDEESSCTLEELKAKKATWNVYKRDIEIYDTNFLPLIYLFHDHKNTYTIELDANYAFGLSPYERLANDENSSALPFAQGILERMIGIGDNIDDISDEKWKSMLQDFSDNFIDYMIDVQDGCFCPNELLWENDYKDKIQEIEKYKEQSENPDYDVDINLKKHIVTFRFLGTKRCKFYLDFSTKEEYNKGWFTNTAKYGKSYVNDRRK